MTRRVALLALLAPLALAVTGVATAADREPRQVVSPSAAAGLYAANCLRCHGVRGEGTPDGPRLDRAGARAADFYLRTGYMPLARPDDQPSRKPVQFSERELDGLVRYVSSLGNGPRVPTPHPERGSLSAGLRLFTDHCAGCHQVVGAGGYVTGARVPPLDRATDRQIAEAVRIGPYVMPSFSERAISNAELDSIVRYVAYAQSPQDSGGWALGHVGPIPEGIVAWLLAGTALVATCVVIGARIRR
jgi:ubiquinol-cytochrome c reductase cytochrome c subunit